MEVAWWHVCFWMHAATDMPANETDAEFHPFVSGWQAFLATLRSGCHVPHLAKMGAGFPGHKVPLVGFKSWIMLRASLW